MAQPTDTMLDYSLAYVMAPVEAHQWLVVTPVALCLAAAAVLMMIRHSVRWHPPVAITVLSVLVIVDLLLVQTVSARGPVTMVMGRWLPPFGIAFTVDLAGALFALAAAVVALAGAIYALADINGSRRRYGFYPLLLLLLAGVSGAFLTGDIFNLYVWFEVLLISSFGLIVLGSEREQIDGAFKYAILNLLATTFFLISVGYLYAIFGTLNMADIARKAGGLQDRAPLMTLAGLFVLAFGMKAAAFPGNFWLPASYHTPRLVVSALFAGLLTKVGIYALFRVMVMLFPVQREELSLVIAIVASLTMILGALGALAQNDIRRLFGYVVIAGIGYMLAGIAIGAVAGLAAAIFYALQSVLLMTVLYFIAGEIRARTGLVHLSELGGLWAVAPAFAGLSLALFFAASGLPPFTGFWPKAMLVKAALDIGAWWLAGSILVSGLLVTIALGRVFLFAYWRPAQDGRAITAPGHARARFVPLALLSAPIFVFGLFPETLVALSQRAAEGLIDPRPYIQSVFPDSPQIPQGDAQ